MALEIDHHLILLSLNLILTIALFVFYMSKDAEKVLQTGFSPGGMMCWTFFFGATLSLSCLFSLQDKNYTEFWICFIAWVILVNGAFLVSIKNFESLIKLKIANGSDSEEANKWLAFFFYTNHLNQANEMSDQSSTKSPKAMINREIFDYLSNVSPLYIHTFTPTTPWIV